MSGGGGAMDVFETVECTLHGVEYLLNVTTVKGDTLVIDIEQTSDCSRWRGEFTARYIEDITAKTGNFKKYPVFVKMLLSALKRQSEAVFIDLLTYSDLEALKSRRTGTQTGAGQALQSTLPPNNKRYLILTYTGEFDRVHYPLPLMYEDNPDPEHLKEVIRQLRKQVGRLKEGTCQEAAGESVEIEQLVEENKMLKRKMKAMEANFTMAHDEDISRISKDARETIRELRLVHKERELLQSRAETTEAELERERGLHRREMRRKAKEVQELQAELKSAREELRNQRLKCRELTRELDMVQSRGKVERFRSTYGVNRRSSKGDRRPSPAGSRATSTGSSRRSSSAGGSSRAFSPATSRSCRSSEDEGSVGSRASRQREPRKARFDPTEYIKKKQQREKAAADKLRNRSPGFGSGRSSSAESRSSSIRRERRSNNRSHGRGDRNSAVQCSTVLPSGKDSPKLPKNPRSRPYGQDRKRRSTDSKQSEPGTVYPSQCERATSPGKALEDVKKRLDAFKKKQAGQNGDAFTSNMEDENAPGVMNGDLREQVLDEGTIELADVDSRLQALQNFLRLAKASTGTNEA